MNAPRFDSPAALFVGRVIMVAASCMAAGGCGHGATAYAPQVLAPHELTLRYDDGFQAWAPNRMVAEGVTWEGLDRYVRCVPDAHRHALEARSAGNAALGMTIAGGALAVAGMGGLVGLAFQDNTKVMGVFFAAGISSEVLGLVLTSIGRARKTDANGHAVDAINYYNDAVGSQGKRCQGTKVR